MPTVLRSDAPLKTSSPTGMDVLSTTCRKPKPGSLFTDAFNVRSRKRNSGPLHALAPASLLWRTGGQSQAPGLFNDCITVAACVLSRPTPATVSLPKTRSRRDSIRGKPNTSALFRPYRTVRSSSRTGSVVSAGTILHIYDLMYEGLEKDVAISRCESPGGTESARRLHLHRRRSF